MKQMVIVGHGGPEKLQLRESPDPSPASGEIRICVKASGINFADILARQGLYPDSPKIPCVVGYEVSGTVDTVGPGVDQSWVGRDVFALTRFGAIRTWSLCRRNRSSRNRPRSPTNRPRRFR